MVMVNHSDEDFHLNMGDRIASVFLQQVKTPIVQEVDVLDDRVREESEIFSTGVKIIIEGLYKDPKRGLNIRMSAGDASENNENASAR